ncbi:MAG: hypothetical protein EXX96DRAFT_571118 [Benjaminiella poitrasii]|nr:MAG: hypothetical protein EXX96DRAFT_571118 [Benjaminiella poitrasii]
MSTYQQKHQQHEHFMNSIFEPSPDWRRAATVTMTYSNIDDIAPLEGEILHHNMTRSPIHHQPSLTEIVYEDLNSESNNDEESGGRDSIYYETLPAANITGTRASFNDISNIAVAVDSQTYRRQIDNASIATSSLFTAIDELEGEANDSIISTGIERDALSDINEFMKSLNIQQEWKDYSPEYKALNEAYINIKHDIYKEIYTTMQRIHELDDTFNNVKLKMFQKDKIEKDHREMTDQLISLCKELKKQKEINKNHLAKKEEEEEESVISRRYNNEKIKLNIGGSLFETSLSTLRRDPNSLLATMFSGKHPSLLPSKGFYFIDRDPSHFRLVLNYLRDLRIPPTILQDTRIRQELLQEAKYFRIDGLVKMLQ